MNGRPTSRLKTWEAVAMIVTIYGIPIMLAFLVIAMCTGGVR